MPEHLFILLENIQVFENKHIGSGQFSDVYYGQINRTTPVAIKILKANSKMSLNDLCCEVICTSTIGHHDNVLGLKGVYCPQNTPVTLVKSGNHSGHNHLAQPSIYDRFMILTPFMDKGDLYHQLQNPDNSFNVRLLLSYLRQVASGLSHLHQGLKVLKT